MKVRVSNIQRFCLHDGPGIRTTIFLKGCNLKCPWCANPENMDYEFTDYCDEDSDEKKVVGYDIEALDLYDEVMKDKDYYKLNNGGVTFSGGEPLLQTKKLESLLKKLKENDVNIAVETNLQVSTEYIEIALKYVDEFIIDIKILDKIKNSKLLNGNTELYIKNLELLNKNNKIDTFRIPLSYEYTLTKENKESIISLLKRYNCKKVEIFKIHNLAKNKYKAINRKYSEFKEVKDSDIIEFYNEIKKIGVNVMIIKI